MTDHTSSYTPSTGLEKWLDDRLPIIRFSKEHLMDFPTPKNLNYWWTFGGILAIMLVIQIITGIVLAMHFTPEATLGDAAAMPVDDPARIAMLQLADINFDGHAQDVCSSALTMRPTRAVATSSLVITGQESTSMSAPLWVSR